MANKVKPVFVHKYIALDNADEVTKESEELVAQLHKDGYKKIKVIVHGLTVETGANGITFSWYSTTVLATMSDEIDISQ